MKFTDSNEAYRYLIDKAKSQGISKMGLAEKMGHYPQQITNNLARENIKVSTLRETADVIGLKIELSITSK